MAEEFCLASGASGFSCALIRDAQKKATQTPKTNLRMREQRKAGRVFGKSNYPRNFIANQYSRSGLAGSFHDPCPCFIDGLGLLGDCTPRLGGVFCSFSLV